MNADLDGAFDAIAETGPLVNCITNAVTVNDVANAALFWGGLPVMSDDENDVVDMVAGADGLLLNMGTTDEQGVETMLAAGRSATEHGVPIVLDPVGVGATPARDETAQRLTSDLDIAVINGNYGEITPMFEVLNQSVTTPKSPATRPPWPPTPGRSSSPPARRTWLRPPTAPSKSRPATS